MCVCVLHYRSLLTQSYHVTWVCCLVSMVTGAHVTVVGCCLREPVNDAMHAHYCKHGLIAVIITSSNQISNRTDFIEIHNLWYTALFILPEAMFSK